MTNKPKAREIFDPSLELLAVKDFINNTANFTEASTMQIRMLLADKIIPVIQKDPVMMMKFFALNLTKTQILARTQNGDPSLFLQYGLPDTGASLVVKNALLALFLQNELDRSE